MYELKVFLLLLTNANRHEYLLQNGIINQLCTDSKVICLLAMDVRMSASIVRLREDSNFFHLLQNEILNILQIKTK